VAGRAPRWFLAWHIFRPAGRGIMSLRNVAWLSTEYFALYSRRSLLTQLMIVICINFMLCQDVDFEMASRYAHTIQIYIYIYIYIYIRVLTHITGAVIIQFRRGSSIIAWRRTCYTSGMITIEIVFKKIKVNRTYTSVVHFIPSPQQSVRAHHVFVIFCSLFGSSDRLCGLVVRVLGNRSGGPGSIPGTTKKKK
jgi:hypothetical protein